MKSTRKLFVGQTVVVTVVDGVEAVAYDAVVIETAYTGASALVAEHSKCVELVKEHGVAYIEHARNGKGLSVRVKAEHIHKFAKRSSDLLTKFREVASARGKLTEQLRSIVADINPHVSDEDRKPKKKTT